MSQEYHGVRLTEQAHACLKAVSDEQDTTMKSLASEAIQQAFPDEWPEEDAGEGQYDWVDQLEEPDGVGADEPGDSAAEAEEG